ncbi:hypothetical protein [uncultured Demequina sp.]|uniref:hypothetical protein n=1 Tax=uncultured Demequina sp. TaxID=693499 RepID=UPI0025F85B25|nr:hypothetical protein [uncultured Demequina sp.]
MRLSPLAPVLARDASSVQVGIHRPLVLAGLTASQRRFLTSLDGGRLIGAAERRRHAALLADLTAAGLTASAPPPPACVRFHSGSALAVEAAIALARAGREVSFRDASPARRDPLIATVRGGSRGALAAQRVRRAAPEAQVRSADARAELDVIVTMGVPVTRARSLLALDSPHLLVTCDERGATIGPLVVPGSTPCSQCLGLAAADRDDSWPHVALQCEARVPRTDPLTASVGGALAGAAAEAFLRGTAPPSWRVEDGAVERIGPPSVHPRCACMAA